MATSHTLEQQRAKTLPPSHTIRPTPSITNLRPNLISKLAEVIMGLAQLQKKSLKQDAENFQRRIEDRRPIYFTVEITMKRLSMIDSTTPSPIVTTLAWDMLRTKKCDIAHNLLLLSHIDKNIRWKVTP